MRLKAIKNIDEYKLCFVDDGHAWFTKLSLNDQYGSDWDDAPYEHNADPPEEDENVLKIIYEAHDFIEPRYGHVNSPYSIEAINKGTIPWLRLRDWNSGKTIVSIYAGCTLKKFMQIIQKNGGKIYLQIENIECSQ